MLALLSAENLLSESLPTITDGREDQYYKAVLRGEVPMIPIADVALGQLDIEVDEPVPLPLPAPDADELVGVGELAIVDMSPASEYGVESDEDDDTVGIPHVPIDDEHVEDPDLMRDLQKRFENLLNYQNENCWIG